MPYGMGYGHEKTGKKKGVDTPAGKAAYARNNAETSDQAIVNKLAKTDKTPSKSVTSTPYDVWSGYIGPRSD